MKLKFYDLMYSYCFLWLSSVNIGKTKNESSNVDLTFDFEEWVQLFKTGPESFEQRRLQCSDRIVQSAPEDYQHRLAGLLFQINMEKRRSKMPWTPASGLHL